jgi:hypothetical protein
LKKQTKPKTSPKPPADFRTIDYGDGMHGLMLVGPGHAWTTIAEHFARKLRLTAKVKFDSEAGMFVARSTDQAVLAALRDALEPVRTDKEEFKKLRAKLGPD